MNWIEVKNELPPEKILVLVYSASTIGITTSYYWGKEKKSCNGWSNNGVTHWMHLPEIPKT